MNKLTTLKSVSALALASGLLLCSASAERYHHGFGQTISHVERATDTLFNDYKRELQHRGLWKPRGGYSTVYSAVFRLEDYGDALRKYYEKRASLTSLARVASKIDHQIHVAENAARGCRLSRQFHGNLRHLSRVTHTLVGACRGSDRGRGYVEDHHRHYSSPAHGGFYQERRSVHPPAYHYRPQIHREYRDACRVPQPRTGRAVRRVFRF